MHCVIGLGYVGLPLVMSLINAGKQVIGIDRDSTKVKNINQGVSPVFNVSGDSVREAIDAGFLATTNFSAASEASFIILTVPTPLNENNEPDDSFIRDAIESLLPFLISGQTIVLESTTWPGATRKLIVGKLREKFNIGVNFHVGYSPEREDPGNSQYETKTIPKVISGYTDPCLSKVSQCYTGVINDLVKVTSMEVAEMTKLLENTYRLINISLINQLKLYANELGCDIFEVVDAAATKPFGFAPFYPGPGVGGHCIAVDPVYLYHKASIAGINLSLVNEAIKINDNASENVINKINQVLIENNISSKRLIIWGLSYKRNSDDIRESKSVEIAKRLMAQFNHKISCVDPFVRGNEVCSFAEIKTPEESYLSGDLHVILTDHDCFEYVKISDCNKLIIDTRGRFASTTSGVLRA